MKTMFTVLILIALATSFLTAQTQDKQKPMGHQNHMQMMQVLKDSSMMDMMMSNVAADRQMRMRMMEKMMEYTEGDTASVRELCMMMMKSQHSIEQKNGCGMMQHEKMQGKTNETEKGKQEKEDHDKPHKH